MCTAHCGRTAHRSWTAHRRTACSRIAHHRTGLITARWRHRTAAAACSHRLQLLVGRCNQLIQLVQLAIASGCLYMRWVVVGLLVLMKQRGGRLLTACLPTGVQLIGVRCGLRRMRRMVRLEMRVVVRGDRRLAGWRVTGRRLLGALSVQLAGRSGGQ